MKDLMGERAALEQTKKIIAEVDSKLPKRVYKEIVQKIYSNQLKKFTRYNRITIRRMVKELSHKRTKPEQKSEQTFTPLPRPKNKVSQGSNEKQSQNIAEQGSQ